MVCTVWGVYSVECVQCGVCTVWGVYSVGCVQCGVLRSLYSQFSAKWYKLVMNCSADSLSPWQRRLNRTHSKFFCTLKKSSNCWITVLYFFRSALEMLVEARVSSASSPMQYNRVLTCLSSLSADRPDARRNCSNRHFHRGHLSGVLKSKDGGGCRRTLAILLTPCTICR